MRAILLIFDSLNRHWLPPYGTTGGDLPDLPNFRRLATRSVTYDHACVGSMPCIPARRELHTGRYNFLHRSWGPLEPFDDSMPELLKKAGVYTHLVTDHLHYWADSGGTYHNRYNTYEFIRGQCGDRWLGQVAEPPSAPALGHSERPYPVNREHIASGGRWPQEQVFDAGLEFIARNADADNWLLQIETFDPHEPFFAPDRLRANPANHDPFNWPHYIKVAEPPAAVSECRAEYAATLRLCDESLGRLLDEMDRREMWRDTLLLVTADHGFLLGEHGWWAKSRMPFYREISRIPFFVTDPRQPRPGTRNNDLVQWIDLAPTLLEFFNQPIPPDMTGHPLTLTPVDGQPFRKAALFGTFGEHLNVTDGRRVLMLAPDPAAPTPAEYTLMPILKPGFYQPRHLQNIALVPPLPFTKGCPVLRTVSGFQAGGGPAEPLVTQQFDHATDPDEQHPLPVADDDPLLDATRELLRQHAAPEELYTRYHL
jgi:arylsulfatase A-like enzyme